MGYSNSKRFRNEISIPSSSFLVTSNADSILNYNMDCRCAMSWGRSKHAGSDAEQINQQSGQITSSRWLTAKEGVFSPRRLSR